MSTEDEHEMIKARLPSSLTAYHDFVQRVLAKLQGLGWPDKVLFGIHMAMEESISNAIRHGNKENCAKQVEVECRLSEQHFWIKVCDEGDGYEPDAVPDCCADENLEVPGGRGLALMRAYMTSVEHRQNGRCVVMEKLRDAGGP